MTDECDHVAGIRKVTPSALGCEECLKTGSMWVHLPLCRTCGAVPCFGSITPAGISQQASDRHNARTYYPGSDAS